MSKEQGFFSVPRVAVHALVDNNNNRKTIGGYLVLARFTDRTGLYSQAGASAISRYLGVATGTAKAILDTLKQSKVNPDDITIDETTSERLLIDPKVWGDNVQKKTQWVVNDYKVEAQDKVWLPNSLIDGSDKCPFPLARLIETGNDDLMRALVLLYAAQDEEQVAGVKPSATVYSPYSIGKATEIGEMSIMEAESTSDIIYNANFAKGVLGNQSSGSDAVRRIIDRLERMGLIYRAVTVFDGDPGQPDTEARYTLDTKAVAPSAIQQEDDTLASEMQLFAKQAGIVCSDSAGRFYRRYPVVVPTCQDAHVAEIIRMRHRITDLPDFLAEKLKRVTERHQDAREWLTIEPAPVVATDLPEEEVIQLPTPVIVRSCDDDITIDGSEPTPPIEGNSLLGIAIGIDSKDLTHWPEKAKRMKEWEFSLDEIEF